MNTELWKVNCVFFFLIYQPLDWLYLSLSIVWKVTCRDKV